MKFTCKYIFVQSAVLLIALILSCLPYDGMSRNKDQGTYTTLLKDPKMYTGKASWLYTYRFFPEIDGRLVDSSKIHIPEEYFQHRFQFYGQGGRAGFVCDKSVVDFNQKYGFGCGFLYNHFFVPRWGIKMGVGLTYAVTKASLGAYSDDYFIHDSEGDVVNYSYSVGAVHEDMALIQLDFPFEVTYQYKKFNMGFGMKVGAPMTVNYDQRADNIVQTAYYPAYDIEVDDSWVLGCGKFESVIDGSSYNKSPVFVMATADFEWMIPVGTKNAIGVGIYGDYTFCGITPSARHNTSPNTNLKHKSGTMLSVSKEVPMNLYSESLLACQYGRSSKRMVSNLMFDSFGIRISYCINTRPDKK